MRNNIIRAALLVVLLLGFAVPSAALAGGKKGCSNLGTWFGVSPIFIDPTLPLPENPPPPPPLPWPELYLTGWSVTVTGKSNSEGTNLFEYPSFDATLKGFFVDAVRIGNMRGNWKRTGGNTFDYTFMGFGYNAWNVPLYIAKISGQVELLEDCQYQKTTAIMEVFSPADKPFQDETPIVFELGEFYGYRAKVVPPPPPPYPF
jgi:uncharacterized membrane protein YhdT